MESHVALCVVQSAASSGILFDDEAPDDESASIKSNASL
jgi:hypothetical protein